MRRQSDWLKGRRMKQIRETTPSLRTCRRILRWLMPMGIQQLAEMNALADRLAHTPLPLTSRAVICYMKNTKAVGGDSTRPNRLNDQ